LVAIAWNVTGDSEVTEVVLPISVTYEVLQGTILWDIGAASPNIPSTAADFVAAGVTEYIGDDATVSNVEGAQNMADRGVTVDLSSYAGIYALDQTYTGAGASIIQEYAYIKNQDAIITIGGLSGRLEANTDYSLYVWGMGGGSDQTAIFTFEETEIAIATNDVLTTDAENFMAKFSFTTDATVADTLEIAWNHVTTYSAFNGFAIVPVTYVPLDPIVGDLSYEIITDGTEVVLSFETTYGALYGVEAAAALAGPWGDIATDLPGNDAEVSVTNALTGNVEFYRAYIQE
jgi:hypothetical protein